MEVFNFRNMYSQFNVMDSDDMEMMDNTENGNELTEEEEPRQGNTQQYSLFILSGIELVDINPRTLILYWTYLFSIMNLRLYLYISFDKINKIRLEITA